MDHYPYIAVSGNGGVAVVWQNILPEDAQEQASSIPSRPTWGHMVLAGADHPAVGRGASPDVLYDDRGALHLFYHGQRLGAFTLFHAVSSDGATFDEPDILATVGDLRGAFFPAVHFEGPYVFVVWQGKGDFRGVLADDLYFMRSENYGRSWSSPRRISMSPANDAAPAIAFYRDTIYCVYQNNDDKSWAIKMLRGGDYGKTWTERPLDVTSTNANCYAPQIIPGRSDELVIVWYDTRDVRPSVMSRKYMPVDRAFSAENRLSPQNLPARKPVMVSSGTRVLAVGEEGGRVAAKHTDVYVDTPAVASPTHPANAWSRETTALVQWAPPADESGIPGYAVIVNKEADFIPAVQNLEGNVRAYRIGTGRRRELFSHTRRGRRRIQPPCTSPSGEQEPLAGPLVVSPHPNRRPRPRAPLSSAGRWETRCA